MFEYVGLTGIEFLVRLTSLEPSVTAPKALNTSHVFADNVTSKIYNAVLVNTARPFSLF